MRVNDLSYELAYGLNEWRRKSVIAIDCDEFTQRPRKRYEADIRQAVWGQP
jgi:hypothetical protein